MELRIEQGTLLASAPDLLDPNFMHTVVLVVQHTEEGAYGLVVNRPGDFSIGELLHDHPLLGGVGFPVAWGGPVGADTLQILHRAPDQVPGGTPIAPGLFLGGELDAVARLVRADPARARALVRFVHGYSGWGAGQLEHELGIESWLPAPFEADVVFGPQDEGAWRRLVRSLGGEASGLDGLPPDVSWN